MNREKKYPTSIRLSDNAKKLIERLSHKLGISQSSILELAVRALAKQEKIEADDGTGAPNYDQKAQEVCG